jgi:hypothetical protein
MAYNPIEFSTISDVGVNSYVLTAPSGALWNGINFLGAGEQNDFAYVGVNLQTDEAGTLTFQFSQDGTNWSKYPVTEFTIASGINEVHTAWKGGRYIRPVYSGSNGSKTYFRLQTYYSNHPLPLTAPINQSIGSDQDATVVRSVITGQEPDGTFSNQKQIGYGVSTTTTLSGSEVFTGDFIEISGYQQVQTHIVSDVDGTMKFEFSEDGTVGGIKRTLNIPYAASAGFQLLSAPCFTKYVRYSYTNGTTPQTNFLYDTKLLTSGLSGQVLPLNGNIAGAMVANLGRNVIVGQDPAGTYRNVPVDAEGDLTVRVDNPTTAFGELQVADMDPQVQITFPYNINTEIVTPVTSSTTATVTQANQMARLNTGATAGVSASLQSNRTAKYRAGQGIDVRFTALFTTGSTSGTKQLAGVGNLVGGQPQDGYFFGMSGSSFGIWTYLDSVGTFISSSGFSIDQFNGAGRSNNPSGFGIVPDKGNVYNITYQWLGYGAITFTAENPSTGRFAKGHVIEYANANVVPSTTNPTFPLTYFVDNGGNAEDIELKSASGAVFVGGIDKITGPSQSTGSVFENGQGSGFALEGVPVMPSGSSNTSYVSSYLRSLSVSFDGANNTVGTLEIIDNATITSPVNNYIDPNNSAVRAVNGTIVAGTGKKLLKISIPHPGGQTIDLTEYGFEIQPGRNLTFLVGGDNGTLEADVTWVEDF